MSALPKHVTLDCKGLFVWPWLLTAEENASLSEKGPKYQDKLISARVLGHTEPPKLLVFVLFARASDLRAHQRFIV